MTVFYFWDGIMSSRWCAVGMVRLCLGVVLCCAVSAMVSCVCLLVCHVRGWCAGHWGRLLFSTCGSLYIVMPLAFIKLCFPELGCLAGFLMKFFFLDLGSLSVPGCSLIRLLKLGRLYWPFKGSLCGTAKWCFIAAAVPRYNRTALTISKVSVVEVFHVNVTLHSKLTTLLGSNNNSHVY